MPLAGAGMRRHVHSGNHAAESFVSFIPLFDSQTVEPRSAMAVSVDPASDGASSASSEVRGNAALASTRVRQGCISRAWPLSGRIRAHRPS